MVARLKRLWSDASPDVRRHLLLLYGFLFVFNVATWAFLFLVSSRYATILGLATLAYGFGLRHAVDPDHIAAIDNTTRKLMQEGKRPVGVGLFFSLGHSTVVFLLSLLVAISASYAQEHLASWEHTGSIIGTSVSGFFLLVIGVINLIVLVDIYKEWRKVARGGRYDAESLEDYLNNRGLLARFFRPLLRVVSHSWHMFPIGFLFGLGFDTASEVGLLGLSAIAGASNMPFYYILLLPLVFAAGMSLVDATDGVLMLGAYGWAYVRPVRKLYYNLNITLISVMVALVIGGIELLQVISEAVGLHGGVWKVVGDLDLSRIGFLIIGIFVVSWTISMALYRVRGLHRLEDSLHGSRDSV